MMSFEQGPKVMNHLVVWDIGGYILFCLSSAGMTAPDM